MGNLTMLSLFPGQRDEMIAWVSAIGDTSWFKNRKSYICDWGINFKLTSLTKIILGMVLLNIDFFEFLIVSAGGQTKGQNAPSLLLKKRSSFLRRLFVRQSWFFSLIIDFIKQFDGEGHWHLDTLDSGTMMTLNEEKLKLESKLAGVAKLEERLKEVYQLLGEDSSSKLTNVDEQEIENNSEEDEKN